MTRRTLSDAPTTPEAAEALPAGPAPSPEPAVAPRRLTLRLDELAAALGVSRRAIERERAAGRFPRPDLHVGKMPLWRPETIQRWIEGGGRS